MVTTTVKRSDIHLDHVHPISCGVESRQADVLMPEGGLKLGEGEVMLNDVAFESFPKRTRPDVSIWSRDTLGSENGRKTVN